MPSAFSRQSNSIKHLPAQKLSKRNKTKREKFLQHRNEIPFDAFYITFTLCKETQRERENERRVINLNGSIQG
jgi:hypothetical protein